MADTGLACALRDLDADSFDADADPTAFGGLLESFVFNELVRAAPLQAAPFSLWHWTGRGGREIDIVAESRRRLVDIEVKASSSVSREDLKHLRWFAGQGPGKGRRVTSILLYLGTSAPRRSCSGSVRSRYRYRHSGRDRDRYTIDRPRSSLTVGTGLRMDDVPVCLETMQAWNIECRG